MKRLSALIALMLCVTIGGVYATWSYAGTDDIADANTEIKATLEGTTLTGSNGTYEVTSNLVLTVDQKDVDDHTAVLKFASNDGQTIHLTVTFTPAQNAPAEIKNSAVATEMYFGTTTEMKYKMDVNGNYAAEGTPTEIFNLFNPSDSVFTPNVEWTKNGNIFTYTLNEDNLKEKIKLNRTFVLDTKAEHDAFAAALNGNIIVYVTDGKVDGADNG